jgi:hypothetical protein
MKHNDNDEQIVLRVPRQLREQLEQEASASERTLASMTRLILKDWAARRQAEERAA